EQGAEREERPPSGLARADAAADPGENEEGEEGDAERVGGITEEERQALDERHLQEHEADADRREEDAQPELVGEGAPERANEEKRDQEDDGREAGRHGEQHEQEPLTEALLPVVDRTRS